MKQKAFNFGLRIYSSLLLLLLLAPIFVILLLSLNDSSLSSFPLKGLTLKWFSLIIQDESLRNALFTSLIMALTTSVLASFIGFLLAYSLAHHDSKLKPFLRFFIVLIIIIPWITISLSSLIFYSRIRVNPGIAPVIFTLTCLIFPYVTLLLEARIEGFPKSIEEAAMDLGANRWQVAKDIYLPLVSPTLLAAFLVAFMLSFGDFIISYFLIGENITLPLKIFSMLKYGLSPAMNALASLLILAVLLIYGILSFVYRNIYREKSI